MKSRLTIKDIAQTLNIHHSTVSRALRNDPKVKEETRNKIRKYANENGYRLNINALKLRGEARNVIAVVVPNIHHSFFSNMVSYITNFAKADGYLVSIFQSNESLEEEKEIIGTLIQNNIAGLVASISLETVSSEHFQELSRFDTPLVFFDRFSLDVSSPQVVVNNKEIVLSAVEHLHNNGFTRIAHLTGKQSLNVFRERSEGYLAGIQQAKLDYQKDVEIVEEFNDEIGRAIAVKLLEDATPPNAMIIDSQNLAIGVIYELAKRNVKIPDEMGLVVFSDNRAFDIIPPGITSITQPIEDIAAHCYNLLKRQIDGEQIDCGQIKLNCQLEIRGSSQKN